MPGFDSAYQRVELLLATQLPLDTQTVLLSVYGNVRSPVALYRINQVDAGIGGSIAERVTLGKDFAQDQVALLKHAVQLVRRELWTLKDRYPLAQPVWPQQT